MLLVSTDPTLVASVEDTVASIAALDLEVVEDVDQAGLSLGRGKVLVVVYHLNEARCVTGLTRLLQEIALEKRRVSVLVVSDTHRPAQALALLRIGVADYLSRPLDLNHLAYLVELLLISSRHDVRRTDPPAVKNWNESLVPALDRPQSCRRGDGAGPDDGAGASDRTYGHDDSLGGRDGDG